MNYECPECEDGEYGEPDRCPLCGQSIREQRAEGWEDFPALPEPEPKEQECCPF